MKGVKLDIFLLCILSSFVPVVLFCLSNVIHHMYTFREYGIHVFNACILFVSLVAIARVARSLWEGISLELYVSQETVSMYEDMFRQVSSKLENVLNGNTECGPSPSWVDAGEHLPSSPTKAIARVGTGDQGVVTYDICFWDGKQWIANEDSEVTHWMPIPEEPKQCTH